MIFVTIGTQLPFDRLIRCVDDLAPRLNEEIIAQTCHFGFAPKNIKTVDFIAPDEFDTIFERARLIVSHAGVGTILTALQKNKPIVVVPRIAALGEHRNEHQLSTVSAFKDLGYVHVAMNEEELTNILLNEDIKPLKIIGESASSSLIASVQEFIGG